MPRNWKTRTDGSSSQIGQKYQEREGEYPYGARRRASGVAQAPQPRSVESMKAPHTPQWEKGYERGLIEGKADAVKPWRAQAENWRDGYAAGVAASRHTSLTTVEKHGTLIRHKTAGTEGQIVGTYMMGNTGGFRVYVPKENRTFGLPFTELDNWEKVESGKEPIGPKGFLEKEYLDGRITQEQYESRRREREKKGEKCRIENGLCMTHGYSVSPQVPCPIGGARGWNTVDDSQIHVDHKNGRYWARVDGYGNQYLGYGATKAEAVADAREAVKSIKEKKPSNVQAAMALGLTAEHHAAKPGAPAAWNPPSVDNIEVPKTRGFHTEDVRVKKVELHRAEGRNDDPTVGKWMTFDNLEDANKQLTENGRGMPAEQQGYDKHDFKVHFTDGSVYTGRYDLHRNEQGDIGNQMHSFSGHMAAKKTKEDLPYITKQDRWQAAYMHKITDKKHLQPVSEKVKPESLASLEAREKEYWKGMREAEDKARAQGKDENTARVDYARLHGKKRDLSPDIYRTTIGHYGGMFIEVPEEKFEGFKSHFPPQEFPRKVESNDLNDTNKYGPEAAGHYHKVFPGFSGKTKTVFFANGSKGEKRLDYYELPHERETNPGD